MACNGRISKASNVGKLPEIFDSLSKKLATIDEFAFVKIYKGRILASNTISENGKKQPVTEIGLEGIVGVELLVDVSSKVVQFYSLTSSVNGCGQQIVSAVLEVAPNDWKVVVVMDWSEGFWELMSQRYPRLVVW